MVMTPRIQQEWNENQSGFARRWRASMVARKKVVFLDDPMRGSLRAEIDRQALNRRDFEEILNDVHLIEAALATDSIVISADQEARRLFSSMAQKGVGELRPVVWVNPGVPEETGIEWLRAGAQPDRPRQLGQVSEGN